MVKLTAKNDWQKAAFYFHNMQDCRQFIKEFENRGAKINWNNPEESEHFPEFDLYHMQLMNKSISQRVEDNIGWAFNSYCKDNPECDISSKIAAGIMSRIGGM